MTYEFLVTAENPRGHEIGTVVEVQLSVSQYEAFKEEHKAYLERYIGTPIGFKFGESVTPPGQFMESMDYIRNNYPGAKGMMNDTKWRPAREW